MRSFERVAVDCFVYQSDQDPEQTTLNQLEELMLDTLSIQDLKNSYEELRTRVAQLGRFL